MKLIENIKIECQNNFKLDKNEKNRILKSIHGMKINEKNNLILELDSNIFYKKRREIFDIKEYVFSDDIDDDEF